MVLRSVSRLWWLMIYNGSGAVPVPRDSPSVRSRRDDADRLLLVGNGAAGGWHVATYGLALAGRLAGVVQRTTGRGCDVDQVGDEVMNVGGASAWIGGRPLEGYDAVLVVLGMSDAVRHTPVERWTADLTTLVERLLVRTRPGVRVVVAGIEPVGAARVFTGPLGRLAQRHADRLNEATQAVVARFDRARYIALPHPGSSGAAVGDPSSAYVEWARHLAPSIADALTAAGTAPERRAPLPEPAPVGPAPTAGDAEWASMRPLLDRAKAAFRADVAWIGTLDGDRYTLRAASIGNAPSEIPLDLTYCTYTVQQEGAMIVPDRGRDPRFRDNPFLDVVRFQSYAGHPLRAADGSTIGTLCVASIRRRSPTAVDPEVLRRYAAEVEAELERVEEDVRP